MLKKINKIINTPLLCAHNTPTIHHFQHTEKITYYRLVTIQIQSIEMTKQFSTNMYFALIGGLIISFPFTFYQIWSFIKPGLN